MRAPYSEKGSISNDEENDIAGTYVAASTAQPADRRARRQVRDWLWLLPFSSVLDVKVSAINRYTVGNLGHDV